MGYDAGFGGKSRGRGGRESRPVLGKMGVETTSFEPSISFNFASNAAILSSVPAGPRRDFKRDKVVTLLLSISCILDSLPSI